MGRTNIEIDDELIARVMERLRVSTKREAVDIALRQVAGEPASRDELLSLRGSGWSGDLGQMRSDRVSRWSS